MGIVVLHFCTHVKAFFTGFGLVYASALHMPGWRKHLPPFRTLPMTALTVSVWPVASAFFPFGRIRLRLFFWFDCALNLALQTPNGFFPIFPNFSQTWTLNSSFPFISLHSDHASDHAGGVSFSHQWRWQSCNPPGAWWWDMEVAGWFSCHMCYCPRDVSHILVLGWSHFVF